MLIDLLGIPEDAFITVADGETISLGDKILKFIHTPWVHWPETITNIHFEEREFGQKLGNGHADLVFGKSAA
jgi:flavorubredoxin